MFYYLNKNIKFLRKKSNLTMQFLANKLEIHINSLSNIESGKANTSLEILDKLHNIFDISLDDLVYKDLSQE